MSGGDEDSGFLAWGLPYVSLFFFFVLSLPPPARIPQAPARGLWVQGTESPPEAPGSWDEANKKEATGLGGRVPGHLHQEAQSRLGEGQVPHRGSRSLQPGTDCPGEAAPRSGSVRAYSGGQAAQAGPATAGQMLEAWSGGPQTSVKCPERRPWLDSWRVNRRGQEREAGRPGRKLWR